LWPEIEDGDPLPAPPKPEDIMAGSVVCQVLAVSNAKLRTDRVNIAVPETTL
jgi:hypothetical protein